MSQPFYQEPELSGEMFSSGEYPEGYGEYLHKRRMTDPEYADDPEYKRDVRKVPKELMHDPTWRDKHHITGKQLREYEQHQKQLELQRQHEIERKRIKDHDDQVSRIAKYHQQQEGGVVVTGDEHKGYNDWLSHQTHEVQQGIQQGAINGQAWYKLDPHKTAMGLDDAPEAFRTTSHPQFTESSMYSDGAHRGGHYDMNGNYVPAKDKGHKSMFWSIFDSAVEHGKNEIETVAREGSELLDFLTAGHLHVNEKHQAQYYVKEITHELETGKHLHGAHKNEKLTDRERSSLEKTLSVMKEHANIKLPWVATLPEHLSNAVESTAVKLVEMMGPASYGEIDRSTPYGARLAAAKQIISQQQQALEEETTHASSFPGKMLEGGVTGVVNMLPDLMVAGLLEALPGGSWLGAFYFAHGDAMANKDKLYADREKYLAYGTEGLSPEEKKYADNLTGEHFKRNIFAAEVLQDLLETATFKGFGSVLDLAKAHIGGNLPKVFGARATTEMVTDGFLKQLIETGGISKGSELVEMLKSVGTKLKNETAGALKMSAIMAAPVFIKEAVSDLVVNKPSEWNHGVWWKEEVLKPMAENILVGPILSTAGGVSRLASGEHPFSDVKLAKQEALWRSGNEGLSKEESFATKNPAGLFMNVFNLRTEHTDLTEQLSKRADLLEASSRIAKDGDWDQIKTALKDYTFNSEAEKEAFVRKATLEKSLEARKDGNGNIKFSKEHENPLIIRQAVNSTLKAEPNLSLTYDKLLIADESGSLQGYLDKIRGAVDNSEMSGDMKEKFLSYMLQKYKAQLDATQQIAEFKSEFQNKSEEAGHDEGHIRATDRAVRSASNSENPVALSEFLNWELRSHGPSAAQSAKLYEHALTTDLLNKLEKGVESNIKKLDAGNIEEHIQEFVKKEADIQKTQQAIDAKEHQVYQDTANSDAVRDKISNTDSLENQATIAVLKNDADFVEQSATAIGQIEGVVPKDLPEDVQAITDFIDGQINEAIQDHGASEGSAEQQFVLDHVLTPIKSICRGGATEGRAVLDGIDIKMSVTEEGIKVSVEHAGEETLSTTVKNRSQAVYSVAQHLLDEYYRPLNENKPTPTKSEPVTTAKLQPVSSVQHVGEDGVDRWNAGSSAVVFSSKSDISYIRDFTVDLKRASIKDLGLGAPDETVVESVAAYDVVKEILDISDKKERISKLEDIKQSAVWSDICERLELTFKVNGKTETATPFAEMSSPKAIAAREKFIEEYIISGGNPDISVIRCAPTKTLNLETGELENNYANTAARRENLGSDSNKEILEKIGGKAKLINSKDNNNVFLVYGDEVLNGQSIVTNLHRENLNHANVPGLADLIVENLKAGGNLRLSKELALSRFGIEMDAEFMNAADIIKMFISPRQATAQDIAAWNKSDFNRASSAYLYFNGDSYEIFQKPQHGEGKIVKLQVTDTDLAKSDIQLRLMNRGIQVDADNLTKDIGAFKFGKFVIEKGETVQDGYGELLKTYTRLNEPFKNVDCVVRINSTETTSDVNRSVIENKSDVITTENLPEKQLDIISTPVEGLPSTEVQTKITRKVPSKPTDDTNFKKGDAKFPGIPDSYIYNGWVENLSSRLLTNFLNGKPINNVTIKDGVKAILESGDGLSTKEEKLVKKGIKIRSSLLHELDQVVTDVTNYMKSINGLRLDPDSIGDSNASGTAYRLMVASDRVDPYAKTNARLLGVMSTLDAGFDEGLTTYRIANINEAKGVLMSVLGGKINAVEDVLPALQADGSRLTLDLYDKIKDDYGLQVAMFNTFKVHKVDYQNVTIGGANGIDFATGEGGHFRHQITNWNKNLANISADLDRVHESLAAVQEIRNNPAESLDDKIGQYVLAASHAGIDIDNDTLHRIAESYYDHVGKETEYLREGYARGGEAQEDVLKECLDRAIQEPNFIESLGFKGGNISANSEGFLPEIERSLNHATNQSWKHQVQRGDRSFESTYDRYHNYNNPGVARLNILSTLHSGDSPTYVIDAKGRRIYLYQQPSYITEVFDTHLHDADYLAALQADPMYSRYYYINAIKGALDVGGEHNFANVNEVLTLNTPTGRKAVTDISVTDNALLRFELSQADGNSAILRQASDKDRLIIVRDLPPIPQEYIDNPANYIRQVWAGGEAQSLLQALHVRENFYKSLNTDAETFSKMSFTEQEKLINGRSLRNDFGLIEGYHYRYEFVTDGDQLKPRLILDGAGFEPRMFPFLAEHITADMTADEVRLLFNKDNHGPAGEMQSLIDVDLKKITREYIEFLAEHNLVDIDRSLLQEGTYGLEMITGSTKLKGSPLSLVKNAHILDKFGIEDRSGVAGNIYHSVLHQLFNSVELDGLMFGDQALYGSRVNQIKRLGGEYSTVTKFATDFPNEHELFNKPTFKVFNAHDLVVSTPEAHEKMLDTRVGTLASPSRLLKYNLEAAKSAESPSDWGHKFFGKTADEVYEMTKTDESKALDIMKRAMPTDGQSLVTPHMAREMCIRLGEWSAEQELAFKNMIEGKDPSTWANVDMFSTFKCMYWGPDSVVGDGETKTGYAFHKTAYAILDIVGDAEQKELSDWMHDNNIDVLSYGSSTKVFGSDKADIFNKEKINLDSAKEATSRYVVDRDWKNFGHQVPNEPHGSSLRKLGVQITKGLLESASPEVRTTLHKILGDIQHKMSDRIFSAGDSIALGIKDTSVSNVLDLVHNYDGVNLASPTEISKSFFSTFSDSFETKVQGSAAVIVSSAGVFKEPLKFRDEHGYAEGVVNANQVSFIPSHLSHEQKVKVFEKAKADLDGKIELVTYRIPTQGTASAEVLNLKGIVHDAYGDRVYVPHELSSKDGHDNDADKAFISSKAYKLEAKELTDWVVDESAEDKYVKTADKNVLEEQADRYSNYTVNRHNWAAENNLIFREEDHNFYKLKDKHTFDKYLNATKFVEYSDNSLSGLGNKLINESIKVLRGAHGSIDNTITVDGATQQKKDLINKYAYIGNQEGLSAVSPVSLVQERDVSTGGSKTIAAFAYGSSMKVIFDHYAPEGHYFAGGNTPETAGGKIITFYDTGKAYQFNCPFEALNITGHDGVRNATNGFINNDLTALVSMAVDAVKDPITYYANINKHTAGMLTSMILEGHGDNAILFTMQPALHEIANEMESLSGVQGNKQDAFKNVLTTLGKHYDPSIVSDKMIHSLLETEVQQRINKLGSDVMSEKFLSKLALEYKEYQEQGIPMSEWRKDFLLDQMVLTTYAATAETSARNMSKYLVFNDIDSGKIKTPGDFHKALTSILNTNTLTDYPARSVSLKDFLWLDIPDNSPYWITKGAQFLSKAASFSERMPYVLGDNVLSTLSGIVKDNLSGFATNELRTKLHERIGKQMYAQSLADAGVKIDKLLKGDKSLLSQFSILREKGIIPDGSPLLRFIKTDHVNFAPDGKINQAELVTLDMQEIKKYSLEKDVMQAFKDTYENIHGSKRRESFKDFVHDMISLSYVSSGESYSHLFPAEFVRNHEALMKASSYYNEGLLSDTELLHKATLQSLANSRGFDLTSGSIRESKGVFKWNGQELTDVVFGKNGVSEFSVEVKQDVDAKRYIVLGEGDTNSVYSLVSLEEGVARYNKVESSGYEFGDIFVHTPVEERGKTEGAGESIDKEVAPLEQSPETEVSVGDEATYIDNSKVNMPDADHTDNKTEILDQGAAVTEKYFDDKTDYKGAVKMLFENKADLPSIFETTKKVFDEIKPEFEKFGVDLEYLGGKVFVLHGDAYEQNLPQKVNHELRQEVSRDLGVDVEDVVKHLIKHKEAPESYTAINKILGREANDPYFKYLDAKEQDALIKHSFNCY